MDHGEGAGGPILVGASRELPDTILHSWANSTVTKYFRGIREMENLGHTAWYDRPTCQELSGGTLLSISGRQCTVFWHF